METLQLKNVFRMAVLACLSMLVVPTMGVADDDSIRLRVSRTLAPAEGYESVDLFEGIEQGTIEVKFIGISSEKANVIITNVSEKPVAVEMPEVFAGMPLLAQGGALGGLGGGGLGGGGLGGGGIGGGGGGRNQGVGGGFGGGGGGGGFGGGGGGFGGGGLGGGGLGGMGGVFNIPPGKVGRVKVSTVCLEYGKEDPRPSIEYQIVPISKMTEDQTVIEICKALAQGKVDQSSAQAAAWNVANGLSWAELAVKNRVQLSNGYTERFFGMRNLQIGQQLVAYAQHRAALVAKERKSRGEKSDSYSNVID
jgi:hypothetical protein